jgi:hypothetical protein
LKSLIKLLVEGLFALLRRVPFAVTVVLQIVLALARPSVSPRLEVIDISIH